MRSHNLKPILPAPLVVVVGETGSGKSSLALEIAKRFDGEIISADSWAVRKELNIGTAKPAPAEQKLVKHHLIDVIEPCAGFTAAVYKQLAQAAITDITGRGKLPIMVGGTGLYIDGVVFDFSFLKSGQPDQRDTLNNLSINQLLTIINRAGYDLSGIDKRNKRRLIRLVETAGQRPTRGDLRPETVLIGLKLDRKDLKARLIIRTDKMIESGLEQEVRQLSQLYDWDCEGLKGIGYIEWQSYFNGQKTLAQTKAKIIKSSIDLAKRQRTYFKRNPFIHWVSDQRQAVDIVTTFLNKKL